MEKHYIENNNLKTNYNNSLTLDQKYICFLLFRIENYCLFPRLFYSLLNVSTKLNFQSLKTLKS